LRFEHLDASENHLGPAELRAILARNEPSAVRELDLSHNPVTDDGAAVLAEAGALDGLRVLRLNGGQIGDDGLRALATSPYLSRLRVLEVGNNPVGDDGVRAVVESRHLRHLRHFLYPAIGYHMPAGN
jgi:hypothetical protein